MDVTWGCEKVSRAMRWGREQFVVKSKNSKFRGKRQTGKQEGGCRKQESGKQEVQKL